jgi:uncharacterized membrane protein
MPELSHVTFPFFVAKVLNVNFATHYIINPLTEQSRIVKIPVRRISPCIQTGRVGLCPTEMLGIVNVNNENKV